MLPLRRRSARDRYIELRLIGKMWGNGLSEQKSQEWTRLETIGAIVLLIVGAFVVITGENTPDKPHASEYEPWADRPISSTKGP